MRGVTPLRIAVAILIIAAGSIAGAWIFQALGYVPCELCLKERIPYYAGIVLAAFAALLSARGRTRFLPAVFAGLAVIFAAGAALGIYHSGVEWGFWPGPSDCTGALDRAGSVNDFLRQLQSVKVARCDVVSLRVFGLSLAVWNAAISSFLAGLSAYTLTLNPRR